MFFVFLFSRELLTKKTCFIMFLSSRFRGLLTTETVYSYRYHIHSFSLFYSVIININSCFKYVHIYIYICAYSQTPPFFWVEWLRMVKEKGEEPEGKARRPIRGTGPGGNARTRQNAGAGPGGRPPRTGKHRVRLRCTLAPHGRVAGECGPRH